MVIDVSIGRTRVDEAQFNRALNRAIEWGQDQFAVGANARWDSQGAPVGGPGVLQAWHRHVDGLALREMPRPRLERAMSRLRADAAFPVGAGAYPRDFEYMRQRIYEEARRPLTAERFIPVSRDVPVGARYHTARRAIGSGEAQIHRGGTEFPKARTTYVEERFNTAFVVCAVDQEFFSSLTTDWAGLQQFARDMRLAYRLIDERMNRIAWFGAPEAGLPGVLTYPSLAKRVSTTEFDESATGEELAAAIVSLVQTPQVESAAVFGATAVLMSPAVDALVSRRLLHAGTDTTVKQYVLSVLGWSPDRWGVAPELGELPTNIAPNGEHGILAYRPENDSIEHVITQDPTPLPVFQASPIESTTLIVAGTGGVVMPDVGNAILDLVPVA